MRDNPLVSIVCITYNHEQFIAQAIESFLVQKTSFEYEIIIHDDASVDNTAAIIRKYRELYPGKIRAILQTENQYSQKKAITNNLIRNVARGKYIALCEGDDFWISSDKLEKQVQALVQRQDCTACCHNAIVVRKDGTPWDVEKSLVQYELQDVIKDIGYLKKDCRFCQTATLMFERRIISDMTEEQFEKFCGVRCNGDMKWTALIAANGKICHIAEDFACYRYVDNNGSSWSALNRNKNINLDTYLALENIKEFVLTEYHVKLNYQIYQDFLVRNAFKRFMRTLDKNDRSVFLELLKRNGNVLFWVGRSFKQVILKVFQRKNREVLYLRRTEEIEQYKLLVKPAVLQIKNNCSMSKNNVY